MFCRDWTLVKTSEMERRARPLTCRSWGCPECAPARRRQLIATAAAGAPNRFLTLTIRPNNHTTPAERLRTLSHAWRVIVLRLRRLYPTKTIDYLAVCEATQLGEPHLHILLRSPFIPQPLLSAWMQELANSPIVDIRVVKSAKQAALYLAKYIAKQPAQFEGSKRYWQSRAYVIGKEEFKANDTLGALKWTIDTRPLYTILTEWAHEGWPTRREGSDTLIAFHPSLSQHPP